MAVRFRIRTSAGQELSFASHEMFEDFVRSGDLSPDDLVYDGEIGSWSPARAHPTVLEIEYEREAEAEAAARAGTAGGSEAASQSDREEDVSRSDRREEASPSDRSEGADAAAQVGGDAGSDLVETSDEAGDTGVEAGDEAAGSAALASFDLDLAPAEERTPDQEARAFVEKMEAERNSDLGADVGRIEGFTMQDSSTLSDLLEPTPPPAPPAPPPQPPARPPARRVEQVRRERPRAEREPPEPEAAGPGGGGNGRLLRALVLLAILGGGSYLGYAVLSAPASEPLSSEAEGESEPDPAVEPVALEPEPEPEPPPPAREPVIAATEASVRERARERFLTATQSALRDLQPVPAAWASGPYLVVPTDYPAVIDVWQSYIAIVRSVRADGAERYRTAYLSALDDAAIVGEAREARLTAALSDFAASADVRRAHWDRAEALATAALQSHNALVEAEGLLLHDAGVTGGGLGAGVSGRDADAQLLLRQVVELLSSRLDAEGLGPGAGARVREWVWDGFLDAATR
jgi:hypothetical protein